jgi:hypothetical protein
MIDGFLKFETASYLSRYASLAKVIRKSGSIVKGCNCFS